MKKQIVVTFILCLLSFNLSYGLWSICQDNVTQGAGNVGYIGYLSLPLYLTGAAREEAVADGTHYKYRTYGGYIQYGITDQIDVGLHGNYSDNSSIGLNVKYQAVDNLTALVGFDYILDQMMLAPFGTLIGGVEIGKNFSVYGGGKLFNWPNMLGRIDTLKEFGTVIFTGLHIYRKEGWKDQRAASFLPMGLYVELGYPVNIDSKAITITLGLDGFLGLSFPRLQWF
ncbi:MAG: hypothetical protein KGZ86_01775 [Candidatus Latescibacteria bacterium]|nr:hypothetical protein [Candidatus Latescibacterota bacterium]